ncbi:MAG: LysE family transporter [Alphaproteobacteria bacterium]|nr:LysE family transporter [Alphaproteobacteria bacterium]
METVLFFKGLIVGFALAAPVGPVGVLCIRRSLADGRAAAFLASLGAALADTVFGLAGVLGMGLIAGFLQTYEAPLALAGGIFLLALGVHTWRSKVTLAAVPLTPLGLLKDFTGTFAVALANPATAAGTVGAFAALGLAGLESDRGAVISLLAGVFLGSALWWFTLSSLAAASRGRLPESWILRINHASGGLLLVFGLGVLTNLVIKAFA